MNPNYIQGDNITEKMLAQSVFLVEATSHEQFGFWQDHATDSPYPPKYKGFQIKWEQMSPGEMVTIGKIKNRPICVSFRWARLDNHIVTFWEPCSELVDYKMMNKWLDKNFTGKYDGGSRAAMCDAMNFGHCLSAIREFNQEK